MNNELYKMNLGDWIKLSGLEVLRVPGGWIFATPNGMCFVPFNNEFQA